MKRQSLITIWNYKIYRVVHIPPFLSFYGDEKDTNVIDI